MCSSLRTKFVLNISRRLQLLILLAVLGTNIEGRPVERMERSAEDILTGVEFLSIFMNSAEKHPTYNQITDKTTNHQISLGNNIDGITTTQLTNDDDQTDKSTNHQISLDNNIVDITTTQLTNDDDQILTTGNPETITIFSVESHTEIYQSSNSRDKNNPDNLKPNINNLSEIQNIDHPTNTIRQQKQVEKTPKEDSSDESLETQDSKLILSVNTPSAIVSESKREQFSLDESEPVIYDLNKYKQKSDDIIANGANPDYIAQQNARLHSLSSYNQPYRTLTSSRGRSVSYNSGTQVISHPYSDKPWKTEEHNLPDNSPSSKSTDEDYDYTESYVEVPKNKTAVVESVAESKDYFVTRKFNLGDFNESADKQTNVGLGTEQKIITPNWGLAEKNYELLRNKQGSNSEQEQYARNWRVSGPSTERNWGIPQRSYNDQKQINKNWGAPTQEPINPNLRLNKPPHTERNWGNPEQNYGILPQDNPKRLPSPLIEQTWGAPDTNYQQTTTKKTIKISPHTERNWGLPESTYQQKQIIYGRPEQNYEVDEAVSVMTNGRTHGVQPNDKLKIGPTVSKPDDNQKVGYVVEGRDYRKYRVEERTSDGFIVGEYGVVNNNDGNLRGVRYTADGTINPRLIYDALMKFLSL